MEVGDSIFDSIFEEENLGDVEDVDMLDVEEGELIEQNSKTEVGQGSSADVNITNQESRNKNQKRRYRKKRNKRKKGNSGTNVTDINRFVVDVCRRLKERKSYLVWTAVGCLGISAFSDLVKEVEAIQACGGQKTADGKRYRTGGGILWGILKVRDPNAYKEIMKKGNEFEKQFKQPNVMQPPTQNKATSSQGISLAPTDQSADNGLDGSQLIPHVQNQHEQSSVEKKRSSVHDRIRVLVAYDDLLGIDDPKDDSN